ncbi:hypothetical protein, partial [Parabacteroides distasonis]
PYVKAISIVCDEDYYRMYHLIHTVTSANAYIRMGKHHLSHRKSSLLPINKRQKGSFHLFLLAG